MPGLPPVPSVDEAVGTALGHYARGAEWLGKTSIKGAAMAAAHFAAGQLLLSAALAEETPGICPPLDDDGHCGGGFGLHHMAVYLPDGGERDG